MTPYSTTPDANSSQKYSSIIFSILPNQKNLFHYHKRYTILLLSATIKIEYIVNYLYFKVDNQLIPPLFYNYQNITKREKIRNEKAKNH